MCPVRGGESKRLRGSVLGAGTKQFDHGFAEALANGAERLRAAQVAIGSIGADLLPFVSMFPRPLQVYCEGLVVPVRLRRHQLDVVPKLRKLRDGRLGTSDIQVVRFYPIGAAGTQFTDNKRQLWCLQVAAHSSNELRQVLCVQGIVIVAGDVAPSLKPHEPHELEALSLVAGKMRAKVC